jgi:RimJ/RimL family protein N-acetyltransferase
MHQLITDRLYLRNFTPQDRDFIKDLDSDPEVMKYLTNGIPNDDKEVDRVFSIFLSFQNIHEGKYGFWPACLKTTNETIGWFHLRPRKNHPDDLTILELGYRLKKKFWGQGFASEMGAKLVEHGFQNLNAQSICAHTMKANVGSQAVMKKVGMTVWFEDTFEPFPGEDKAAIWYKIDR